MFKNIITFVDVPQHKRSTMSSELKRQLSTNPSTGTLQIDHKN